MCGQLAHELFPFSRVGTAQAYSDAELNNPVQQANIAALRGAARAAADTTLLKELRDIAVGRRADEESRQSSIMTRAQGLFVALALFGLFFTLGSNLLSTNSTLATSMLWIYGVFVAYILTQMIIMVLNILKAIGGANYPAAGSTNLAQWIAMPTAADFYRAQALLTLDNYRIAALNNNWRFLHLNNALKGLRNVVFALSAMILVLFGAAISSSLHRTDSKPILPATTAPVNQK